MPRLLETAGPGAGEQVPAEPPAGAYANSCVGRERMFLHGSHRHRTADRLMRMSYAHWVRDGHAGLSKKTHFETRDGQY